MFATLILSLSEGPDSGVESSKKALTHLGGSAEGNLRSWRGRTFSRTIQIGRRADKAVLITNLSGSCVDHSIRVIDV